VSRLVALSRAGLVAVLLHRLRSATIVLCLLAMLVPYVMGVAVTQGMEEHAETAIAASSDLHVTGSRFGRSTALPRAFAGVLRDVPGVRRVTPRIVGELTLGKERVPAVVVGIPVDALPADARFAKGRLFAPQARNELVLGSELARRLGLKVGAALPPFYHNRQGEHVSHVVGILDADLPVAGANLMFCSLETAAAIFDQRDHVTGFLVACDPGSRESVRTALLRFDAPALLVTSKGELRAALPRSMRHLHGLHHLHFMLAFAVAIPLLMVVSGVGLTERRREAALLKAIGWTTNEVIAQRMVESLVLCLIGASIAVLLAWVWLALFDGSGIAPVFVPGAEVAPAFAVPYRMAPIPVLLAFVLSFALVSVGSVYATWRAAIAQPAEVLR